MKTTMRALRTAVPYIRTYKNNVFVIKIGGRLCEPGPGLDHIVEQIALLYQLGIRVVLVHGGGEQADALGKNLGIESETVAGRRITSESTLEVAKMAFAGTTNTDVLASFRKVQVAAVGISGVDGNLIVAERRPPKNVTDPSTGETREVDFGFVGDIVSIDTALLTSLIDSGSVPVVCSLGADASGQILNINADTIASRIAVEIAALKYFLVMDVPGVLQDPENPATLVSYMGLNELDALVGSGAVSGGMLPKLAACKAALIGGVKRVHLIDGTETDSLLGEVFTNEGCGTLLVRDAAEAGGGAGAAASS